MDAFSVRDKVFMVALLTKCALSQVRDLILTSTCHEYWGSLKISQRLDHISHCKTASGKWSNRWTYRVFIMKTCRYWIKPAGDIPCPRSH